MTKSSSRKLLPKPKNGSFEGISNKFQKNIYATMKGQIRLAVLARDLAPWVSNSARVLDVGAGLGQASQPFAAAGARVVHTDIAADMVAAAQQAHTEAGLASHYEYAVCAVTELQQQVSGQFDVILCHAVLEWLAEPELLLTQLKPLLAPTGILSLMFYNQDAKRFANMIYGNFDYVQADLQVKKTVRLSPHHPQAPAQVLAWAEAAGFKRVHYSGVRCIHDYLRDPKRDQWAPQLMALELEYSTQSPYRELGRYQHFILQQQ